MSTTRIRDIPLVSRPFGFLGNRATYPNDWPSGRSRWAVLGLERSMAFFWDTEVERQSPPVNPFARGGVPSLSAVRRSTSGTYAPKLLLLNPRATGKNVPTATSSG